jgi:glucan phosphoethanolaminetransferase (alkaline phosphatase superfamily)
MNELFKKREVDFLIQLIVLSLVLFGSHNYLNHHFAKDIILFFPWWHIYVFHVITVLAIYTLINYRASIGKTDVFNAFILGMLLKMVLIFVFLLPWLLSKPEQQGFDLANFFVPYFTFLAFEVYAVTKVLQKKEPDNDAPKDLK